MINRPIALLTDFGLKDAYVGMLKSVILGIHPSATIFDITHEIKPHSILEGALALGTIYDYLPLGSIVVAVIDPGVGSYRKIVCVKTDRCFILAPDNGLVFEALKHAGKYEIREISNSNYCLKSVSKTFHGRDIFAVCAARLSQKNIFATLGRPIKRIKKFEILKPQYRARGVDGQIIHIDRFGNGIVNISSADIKNRFIVKIAVKNKLKAQLKSCYHEGERGQLIALWGSLGYLEVAVSEGSAEKKFQLKIGDRVTIHFR